MQSGENRFFQLSEPKLIHKPFPRSAGDQSAVMSHTRREDTFQKILGTELSAGLVKLRMANEARVIRCKNRFFYLKNY